MPYMRQHPSFLTWNWDIAYVLHFCAWYLYIHHISFLLQNLPLFIHFLFGAHVFIWWRQRKRYSFNKNIPLMDFLVVRLFFFAYSINGQHLVSETRKYNWLATINWTHSMVHFSLMLVFEKQCFAVHVSHIQYMYKRNGETLQPNTIIIVVVCVRVFFSLKI